MLTSVFNVYNFIKLKEKLNVNIFYNCKIRYYSIFSINLLPCLFFNYLQYLYFDTFETYEYYYNIITEKLLYLLISFLVTFCSDVILIITQSFFFFFMQVLKSNTGSINTLLDKLILKFLALEILTK